MISHLNQTFKEHELSLFKDAKSIQHMLGIFANKYFVMNLL